MVEEALRRGSRTSFTTVGTSMRWLVPPGSLIDVKGCPVESIRLGDVVLYRKDVGSLIKFLAHRAVRIEHAPGGPVIFLKGDSSPRDAEPLVSGDCVGLVTAVHSGDRVVRMTHRAWRWLNPAIAALSNASGRVRELAPLWLVRLRPRGHVVFPQPFIHFPLKWLIRLGQALSRERAGAGDASRARPARRAA